MKIEEMSVIAACLAAVLAVGCSGGDSQRAKENAGKESATAEVRATQGSGVAGSVQFTPAPGGGVRVVGDFSGLTPGRHGFHVHENGDCSASDASSAGEHFNTSGTEHGARDLQSAHTGDMGNLEADASGKAHLDYVDSKLALDGSSSVIGKAVIVHEKADDLTSQPAGNSGARIGCGVIERGDASADAGANE